MWPIACKKYVDVQERGGNGAHILVVEVSGQLQSSVALSSGNSMQYTFGGRLGQFYSCSKRDV